MVNLNKIDISKNNAIILSLFVVGVMFLFLIIGYIGIPFIGDSPETINANEAVDTTKTDDEVIFSLDEEINQENVNLLIGDTEYNWNEDNQIILDSEEITDDVNIETYSDGNLYDTYVFDLMTESISINSDSENYIDDVESTFMIELQSGELSELEDIEWRIDGNLVERDSTQISEAFNANNTHEISVLATINDFEYHTAKKITIFEPDEVVLDAQVDKKDVETLEELQFNVTEVSNQSVESFNWDMDDGTNRQGDEIGHWYQEEGEYNVTVSGTSEETNREGTDNIIINVTEPEEEIDTYQFTVNVFDSETGEGLDDAEITLNNAISETTDGDGSEQFDVPENEYEIIVERDGYDSVSETQYINENSVLDVRMSEESEEEADEEDEEQDLSDEEELSNEDEEQDTSASFESESTDEDEEDIDEPEGLDAILDNMEGNGTVGSPYIITTIHELQAIEAEPTASYKLGNNINAAETQLWNYIGQINNERLGDYEDYTFNTIYSNVIEGSEEITINGEDISDENYNITHDGHVEFTSEFIEEENYSPGDSVEISYESDEYHGFTPIESDGFAPELDGNGYEIQNMHIYKPEENNVGIFTSIQGSAISNLTISGAEIEGNDFVGVLTGQLNGGTIEHISIGGSITGNEYVGSLSGDTSGTSISNYDALTSITGSENVGGISGNIESSTNIKQSSIQTPENELIRGEYNVGGLVGNSVNSEINISYSLANVHGQENTGNLIGIQRTNSELNNSYTTSNIIGDYNNDTVGSTVGINKGSISNIYAEVNSNYKPLGEDSEVESDEIIELESNEMTGSEAIENMNRFDFETTWEVTNNYPEFFTDDIEIQSLDDTIENFNVVESNRNTETGDIISETPMYENENTEEMSINIIESDIEVYSFTIDAAQIEVDDDGEETLIPEIYTPDTNEHLQNNYAELEGYIFNEQEMELDIIYTSLDENQEPIEQNTNIFILEIANSEEINPNVQINNDIQKGDITQFELVQGEHSIYIEADGYLPKQKDIEISDEDKITSVELEEAPKVDLDVEVSRESEIMINEETKSANEDETVTFEDLQYGEYKITIESEGLSEPIKEIINIEEEDKSITYDLDNPLLTISTFDNDSGDEIETNMSINDITRINSTETYVPLRENEALFNLVIEKDGYETMSESVDIGRNPDGEYENENLDLNLDPE